MATQPQSPERVAFGPFEVNVSAGELLKSGVRIRLPGQPFQLLMILLAHRGVVVTRDELCERVWSEGTFVDFEHGLNAAMNKLRNALGDSAEKPRYIETVAGRGYRFIGIVENCLAPPAVDEVPESVILPPVVEFHPKVQVVTPGAKRRGSLSPIQAWAALAAVATAFGIWGVVTILRSKPVSVARPVVEFVVPPLPGTIFAPPIGRQPFALSPDGTHLAFTATGSNGTAIWIRDLASLGMRSLPGTEGAWGVFWSPDSRSIFYSVKRNLQQENFETGSIRTVAKLPFTTMFGAWRSKSDLLLYLGAQTSYELSLESGSVRRLPGASMRWPQFLSHDRVLHIVFDPALERYRAVVTDYVGRRSTPLMETDSRVEYAPPVRRGEPGCLLYIRGSSLLAQPFDVDRLKLAGEPFAIAQNVTYLRPSASGCFSASETGVLAYQAGFPISELHWYDRVGHVVGTVGRSLPYAGPLRISPDGQQVAASIWSPESGGVDVWIFAGSGKESRRLTFPPAVHYRPLWSPDGKRLIFGSSRTGPPALVSLETADLGRQQQPLTAPSGVQEMIQLPTDWSRDGRFVAFDTGIGEEEQEVWLADTAQRKVMALLHDEFAQWGAVFSPDSKQMAFVSSESGRPEVYVQSFDSAPSPRLIGGRRQISKDGAWLVRWRPDGREIFYLSADNWLYAVRVDASRQFGEPNPLFHIPGPSQYGTTSDFQFDVSNDGQRFIMSTTGSATPPAFTVIDNWQDKFHR